MCNKEQKVLYYILWICVIHIKSIAVFVGQWIRSTTRHPISHCLTVSCSPSLEGNCRGCKVVTLAFANTRNPLISVGIEALEEAQAVLHLHKLCRSLTLEFLAQVVSTYLCISTVKQEEDVLLLILNSVEFACCKPVGLISKCAALSQVGDCTVVTGNLSYVSYTLEC